MFDEELEKRIGMDLACRAYLYDLLHEVFGGDCSSDSIARYFGKQTREMIAHEAAALSDCSREANNRRIVGDGARALEQCAEAALAYIDSRQGAVHESPSEYAAEMKSDYAKLFQIPGDSYVSSWESPYVGTEQALFQCSTLNVREAYHAAGLKLQAERHFPDDHIAAMMEYLAYMGTRAYDCFADGRDAECVRALRTSKDFLTSHVLTWIDAFANKVIEKDTRGYYAAFAQVATVVAHVDDVRLDLLIGRIGK